jgi:hypothetical protein
MGFLDAACDFSLWAAWLGSLARSGALGALRRSCPPAFGLLLYLTAQSPQCARSGECVGAPVKSYALEAAFLETGCSVAIAVGQMCGPIAL